MRKTEAFFLGFIGATFALFLQLIIFSWAITVPGLANANGGLYGVAPLFSLLIPAALEEFLKLILLIKHQARARNFPQLIGGAFFLGLGFFSLELLLLHPNLLTREAAFELLKLFLLHSSTTMLIAFGLFLGRFPRKINWLGFGFLAFLLHGTYNYAAHLQTSTGTFFTFFLLVTLVTFNFWFYLLGKKRLAD